MEMFLLLTLMAVGIAVFFALQAFGARRRSDAEERVLRSYFLLGLSGLMAKLAMADGRVTGDEAEMASRFFSRMEITADERAMCVGNFVSARRDGLEPRDHVKRFMAYGNTAACEFLYDMLWRMSRIDGTVDPAEDRLLKDIAVYLGLGEKVYAAFKAGKRPRYDKGTLRAAGVPESLTALAR